MLLKLTSAILRARSGQWALLVITLYRMFTLCIMNSHYTIPYPSTWHDGTWTVHPLSGSERRVNLRFYRVDVSQPRWHSKLNAQRCRSVGPITSLDTAPRIMHGWPPACLVGAINPGNCVTLCSLSSDWMPEQNRGLIATTRWQHLYDCWRYGLF